MYVCGFVVYNFRIDREVVLKVSCGRAPSGKFGGADAQVSLAESSWWINLIRARPVFTRPADFD